MKMKISIVLVFLFVIPMAFADLRVGFYDSTCPQAESIIRNVVQRRFRADRSITAALLRMYFHDCFVRGCDASILIDTTNNKHSEKSAGPNRTVRGYEIIDEVKRALEAACPSTVSCADIISLATRDSVLLAGGPSYAIPTGRRDGLVSNPDDVNDVNLPGPSFSVQEAFRSFSLKGFTLTEMVTLLGGHTVGIAHCDVFQDRLSPPDPTMDPALAAKLSNTCNSATSNDPTAFLDQNTSFVVDNEFYRQILARKGILHIDQQLALDKASSGIVSRLASNGNAFRQSFANAMIKLGNVGVLTGNAGEIRKNCRAFNQPTKRQK